MKYLVFLLFLVGCTTLSKEELVATRAYELGCVDRSDGSWADMARCTKKAENFRRLLSEAWGKGK